jgi:uncharacterized protein
VCEGWRGLRLSCSPEHRCKRWLWRRTLTRLGATTTLQILVMASIEHPLSGRQGEREILTRLRTSPKSEFLALYGRRRVGKTFLVRRFFREQPVTYFEMIGRFRGSLDDHLRIFSEALGEAFYGGAPLQPPDTWHDAFRALRTAIETRGRKKRSAKIVLFFDELPWIATHRSGFLAELEHFWNAWCSRRADIILIVCGSAASWMLKRIVNAKGGLHDRLTQTIRLLPFTLPETRAFFEARQVDLGTRELIELYMIFGGVPHYLDHVERGRSVPEIVDRVCLAKDGALANEFSRLFASLFDSDEKYVAVVRALARKRRGLTRNELLAAVDMPSGGGATTILENLEEGGFITATIPFGRTGRDRFFRLTDEFSLFHLKWLDGARPRSWQHVRKTPRWRAWVGLAFESVCLEHAAAIERALGISGVETHVSAWLHDDAQIDMLIDRADDVISVCEMKFTDEPFVITKKYADELRNKAAVFRAQTGTKKAIHVVLVTSYGLVRNRHADELVDHEVQMDVLLH